MRRSCLRTPRGAAVIAASDLARARSFYEGVLGLKVAEESPDQAEAVLYELGGTRLMVYATSFAGTAKNTVFAIDTDDLARDMAVLRDKGVVFMDYDFPGLVTVNGVTRVTRREVVLVRRQRGQHPGFEPAHLTRE